MLEWTAQKPTEIETAIDLEFLPTDANEDRGVHNLEFVLQQMHTALVALTSYATNDIVANSRKNPLEAWRRLQKRHDPTTRGRERNFLRMMISPGRCSLLVLKSGYRTLGIPRVSLREEDCGTISAIELNKILQNRIINLSKCLVQVGMLFLFDLSRQECTKYTSQQGFDVPDSPTGHGEEKRIFADNKHRWRQVTRCVGHEIAESTNESSHCLQSARFRQDLSHSFLSARSVALR